MQVVTWTENKSQCELCGYTFGYIYRAHHCRACGRCVCNSCSPRQLESKDGQFVRACTPCFDSFLSLDEGWETLKNDRIPLTPQQLKNCQENALPPPLREKLLCHLLSLAIQGSEGLNIKSTTNRRYSYVQKYKTTTAALLMLKNKATGWKMKVKASLINSIPFIGIPTALICPLWHQLRLVCLVAALYNHDLHNELIQNKIVSCLGYQNSTDKTVVTAMSNCTQAVTAQVAKTELQAITLECVSSCLAIHRSSTINTAYLGIFGEQWTFMRDEGVRNLARLCATSVGWGFASVLSIPVNLLIEWLSDHSLEIFLSAEKTFFQSEKKK